VNIQPLEKLAAEGEPHVGGRLSQINPTRSLILMAIGAVVGIGIAGFGLFTASGTTVAGVPAEDVALVNNKPVLRSDFIAQVEAENGVPFAQTTRAQRLKVLDEMIREELFVQRGLELDFPASDPDTRSALVAAVEQQVVADVTSQKPKEEDLRAFYESHKDAYSSDGTMTLHEYVLPGATDAAAMAKAAQAVQALRGGAALEPTMARFGLNTSGRVDDGEEFYFAAKIHLGDPLFELARTLKNGAVSDPQAAPDGVHVLVMVENNQPVPLAFADAREKVLFDYKKAEEDKLEKADEKYLRSKADIQIAKDYK
jgi:parvulin-like peptidyl-prolyl isomerase